jgi:hypothetical protein
MSLSLLFFYNFLQHLVLVSDALFRSYNGPLIDRIEALVTLLLKVGMPQVKGRMETFKVQDP